MKNWIAFAAVLLGMACAGTKKQNTTPENLDGTWAPVSLEMGGNQMPAASFEKQRLTLNDSLYTYVAESVDKGVARYANGKMDLYGKDGVNAGKHFTAIYKLENGALTVCYNLAGDHYPTAFETKSNPMYFMAVFQKQK